MILEKEIYVIDNFINIEYQTDIKNILIDQNLEFDPIDLHWQLYTFNSDLPLFFLYDHDFFLLLYK